MTPGLEVGVLALRDTFLFRTVLCFFLLRYLWIFPMSVRPWWTLARTAVLGVGGEGGDFGGC